MKVREFADEAEWLAWRADNAVTASDVADSATGSYGGIYAAVAKKLGLLEVEQTAEMQRGHDWEQRLADTVHTLTGYYVVGEQWGITHDLDDRFRFTADGFLARTPEATLDGLVAGYECKTTGVRVRFPWERTKMQCQWQMVVSELPRTLLLVARIDDDDDTVKGVDYEWVEADPDVQAQLVEVAEVIYGHVQSGTLPEPDSPSALDSVKAVHAAADVDADAVDLSDLAEDIARFDEIKAAVKAVSDERDLLEARIRDAIGEATKGHLDGWRISLSQPARKLTRDAEAEMLDTHPEYATAVLDRTRVKAEDPELYEAFTRPVGPRRLTITPPKGDQ